MSVSGSAGNISRFAKNDELRTNRVCLAGAESCGTPVRNVERNGDNVILQNRLLAEQLAIAWNLSSTEHNNDNARTRKSGCTLHLHTEQRNPNNCTIWLHVSFWLCFSGSVDNYGWNVEPFTRAGVSSINLDLNRI